MRHRTIGRSCAVWQKSGNGLTAWSSVAAVAVGSPTPAVGFLIAVGVPRLSRRRRANALHA
jgi:hypothetical protein